MFSVANVRTGIQTVSKYLSGRSIPNESGDAANAKMILP